MIRVASAIGFRRWTGGALPRLVGVAALGAASGVLAKVADESGVGWLSDLGSYPGAWILIVALFGFAGPTPGTAAGWSALFFVAMCLGYYAWSVLVLGFPLAAEIYLWLAAAITVAPVTGAAAWWATRRRGAAPGLAVAGIAGLALSSGKVHQFWLYANGLFPEHALRPIQATLEIAMALTIALMLPRDALTRVWAGVGLVPMVWMAPRIVDLGERVLRALALGPA